MTGNSLWPNIHAWSFALLTLCIFGCEQPATEPAPRIVVFDTASKRPVVIEAVNQFPAIHPDTGRPTLMPALYCAKCAAWHLVPPLEELARSKQPAVCVKCKSTLTIDGPLPSGS